MTVISLTENTIKNQIEKIRPPKEIRDEFDIGYTFQNNVLEVFEIRKDFLNADEKNICPVARVRYNKSKETWKIYWHRANGDWEAYESPEVKTIDAFFQILEDDKYGCFWG